MQQIANEIHFSETTFITSRQPRDGGFDVRRFTPKAEVEFAGHPTLGTAYVIRERLRLTSDNRIGIHLKAGRFPVTFSSLTGEPLRLWMQQLTPKFGKRLEPGAMASVLGLSTSDIAGDYPIEEVSTGFPTLVVPVANLSTLQRITIARAPYLEFAEKAWAKLILAFSRESYHREQHLSVRVFGDYYGIPEDAATGSGNGALAAYLVRHRFFESPVIDVTVGQGYELSRPSSLALRARESKGEIEVMVGGSVVDVAEGVWS